MLIGTGQDIATYGPSGMLFAVSAGIGILFLLLFANFYWKAKYPLWDLFEIVYGKNLDISRHFYQAFG